VVVLVTPRVRTWPYLAQYGPLEDPTGGATAKLREALSYEGSQASFTQLISNMDRAGQLMREVKGKRTYRILGVEQASQVDHDSVTDSVDPEDPAMDYDAVAAALLVQVVQTMTKGNQTKESDGSWARRRIERLERRVGELERELLVAKAESKTLAAERDQLGLQLEHSEGNLALLAERLPAAKARDGQLSKLLDSDERALLHQLRSGAVKERPTRAS
jgi:urease gamma subunit